MSNATDARPSGLLAGRIMLEPEILTILGTYKCTASCEHCCFGSNPYITERLGLPQILSFIDEGSRYSSCKVVVFSGGECFVLRDDLNTAIRHATGLGLSTRCVTNGYWAKRIQHGRKRLEGLVDAGLTELNISTGDYHQQWVSQEAVINAACLSVEFGLATVVVVELQKERRVTAALLRQDLRIQRLITDHARLFRLIESPWMPMDHEQHIEQADGHLLNRGNVHLRTGCTSVFKTLVITPKNRLGFCCGLSREYIPQLNADWDGRSLAAALEEGAEDFMKIWLSLDGPDRILAWAASKDNRIEWENRYAHHCHSCLALFKDRLVRDVIREHYRERVEDVLARYVMKLRSDQRIRHGDGGTPPLGIGDPVQVDA